MRRCRSQNMYKESIFKFNSKLIEVYSLVCTPHKQTGITRIDIRSGLVWCVLQNISGWVECSFEKKRSAFFFKLPCVTCCVSCINRCWLSSSVNHGAWRGLRPRPQFDDCCRRERRFKLLILFFLLCCVVHGAFGLNGNVMRFASTTRECSLW
jgi:hypothetical protein